MSRFTGAYNDIHEGREVVVMSEYVGDLGTVDRYLTPEQAFDLGWALVAAGHRAQADQLRSTLYGDCETCANTRMIQDPAKGRSWTIYCPDCNADGKPRGTVPVIGRNNQPEEEL